MNFELCNCGQPAIEDHLCPECLKHRDMISTLTAGPDLPAINIPALHDRIKDLEDALCHLLEVQTAPSFDKPHERDEKAMKLYNLQTQEWVDATADARRVLRG